MFVMLAGVVLMLLHSVLGGEMWPNRLSFGLEEFAISVKKRSVIRYISWAQKWEQRF